MKILLKIWTEKAVPYKIGKLIDNKTCLYVLRISVVDIINIKEIIKKHNAKKWRLEIDFRLKRFFKWFGKQNDYLFPFEGASNPEVYPFKKPHLWKTRFGFKTSWTLSNY